MGLQDYVTLGRSGLKVSPMCLGSMTFGEDLGWGASVEVSERIIDKFIERGGNFIDTANIYTYGHSEKIIGDHIGRNSGLRDRLVIATKFYSNFYSGDPNGGGASCKSIIKACEHSLRRLQTDYIDLYWMHAWDMFTPIAETMRTLEDLVTSGKVRYIGFSDTPAWKTTEAQLISRYNGWAPLIAVQVEYSLLERTIEGEIQPMATNFGLGITPWSPLKSGILSGKYTRANAGQVNPSRGEWVTSALNEKTYRIIDSLLEIAHETSATPAQVALSWLHSKPVVSSIIIGARTEAQLDDNLRALEISLKPEFIERLDSLSKPELNFPAAQLEFMQAVAYSGVSVNGQKFPISRISPPKDSVRY
jgi:aryl-alcohol dehydrogenase-like predicted oxidoreductase